MAADILAETSVSRIREAPGWYTAELSDAYNWETPAGGVLMTVAMRAMAEEIGDPTFKPISATTLFCSPVPHGPLEIRVEILRKGNAAAQVRAALSSTRLPGPGLEVSATFCRDRTGPEIVGARMPLVRRPEQAPSLKEFSRNHDGVYPFLRNVDVRLADGYPFWAPKLLADHPEIVRPSVSEARFSRWYKYLVPPLTPEGTLHPMAIPPIADTMPGAIANKLGPGSAPFKAPSLDLTVHFLEPTRCEWLLVASYSRRARGGIATAEAEIWSEEGTLVAYATQTMMLRTRKRDDADETPDPQRGSA